MSGWTAEITVSLQFGGMREGMLRSGPVVEMAGGDTGSSIDESSSGVSCESSEGLNVSSARVPSPSPDGQQRVTDHHQNKRYGISANTFAATLSPSNHIAHANHEPTCGQRHMNCSAGPASSPGSCVDSSHQGHLKHRTAQAAPHPVASIGFHPRRHNKRHGIALPPHLDPHYDHSQGSSPLLHWHQVQGVGAHSPTQREPEPEDSAR